MDVIHAYCRKIRKTDLEMLMEWRMRPDITQYMNTDPSLTLDGQKKWFHNIQQEELKTIENGRKAFYWILEVDDIPSGFVSLVDIDANSMQLSTGVYIAVKEKRSLRLSIDIQWNLYRYAFDVLNMHKVCEEVFEDNKAVNRILDMCGSKKEGVLRDAVYKNGKYYNIVTRGILKREWDEKKNNLEYNLINFEQ